MVVAGLTGGIATGKSTVASILASCGAEIIDADRIAREVVRKGTPAWLKIRETFGDGVLLNGGELDRERLGAVIFSDHEKKELLNRIVHPAVYQEMDARLAEFEAKDAKVVVCDIPLLIETGMEKRFQEIILVYVPELLQLKRLMDRNGLSREDAVRKMRSQMPIEEKKAHATIIIDNSGSPEETSEKTLEVYEYLKSLAG